MGSFRRIIKSSFYLSRLKKYSFLILLSLVLAVLCTAISYPGILYSDSYTRIENAKKMIQSSDVIYSWNTPTPSYFIALSLLLTYDILLYTFVQAWLFFFITFVLIIRLGQNHLPLKIAITIISPMIWGASVYYEAGVGCAAGMAALIVILSIIQIEKGDFDRLIEFFLLFFFSFVVFGYRANAFTIIPVLAYAIFRSEWRLKLKIFCISSIISGLLFVTIMAGIMNVNTMSSKSAGFVWEILVVLDRVGIEKQECYATFLDDIGGEGATLDALEKNIITSIDGFIWDSRLNNYVLSEQGNFRIILAKYVYIITNEPKAYYLNKFDSICRSLGIGYKLNGREYDYNRWGIMDKYGFHDTNERKAFVETYNKSNKVLGWYCLTPWLVYFISIILLMFEIRLKNRNTRLFLFVIMIAVFYYGAFLINTQSYEIRYFYPSLYLLSLVNLSMLTDIISCVINKLVERNAEIIERR
ncbi:MAG: hypothetical protein K5776_05670 [Lachnospiraceae bacterium]|nr:hypothetical protein [Lachnospiraceae bacterium]